MLHVITHYALKPENFPAFLRDIRELAILVRQEPGCLDFFPAQNLEAPEAEDVLWISVLEKWSTTAAWQAHVRSGHMRGFSLRTQEILAGQRRFVLQEI